MSKVQIANITERDLTVDVLPLAEEIFTHEEYEAYKKGSSNVDSYIKETAKKVLSINELKGVYVEAIINGAPPEVINALQRATTAEQDHYAFDVRFEDVETSDRNMNIRELIDNITFIPLRYGVTDTEFSNAEFSIDINNDGFDVIPVMTGDLKVKGFNLTKPLFHPTIELIYLNPKSHLVIKNIRIVKGNTEEHTKFLTASNGVIWPLDRAEGAKTSRSIPMKHRLSFRLNVVSKDDKTAGRRALIGGCQNLLFRLHSLIDMIEGEDSAMYFQEFSNHSVLEVIETNSIVAMFDRVCYTLHPKIGYISADLSYHTKHITLTVQAPDSKKIMLNAFKECIRIYEDILKQLSTS